jgi:hypothetical protein
MVDRDLMREVELVGLACLGSLADRGADLPSGVRVLDQWRSGEHGGVLFWVSAELDLWGFGDGHTTLHLVEGQRIGGAWRLNGGGGWGTFPAAEYIASDGAGLHRLGASQNGAARSTIALASSEVSLIELRTDHRVWSRSPGAEGFCLLRIPDSDSITYARPLDATGQPFGSESLLL